MTASGPAAVTLVLAVLLFSPASCFLLPPIMSLAGVGHNKGIDVAKVRADTRGCAEGMGIHFNNAGASMMPRIVASSCREVVDQEEMEGGYETAAK